VPGEVDHHEQWRWPRPYRVYADLLARGSGTAAAAEAHRRAWTSLVAAVPDGAAALVICHGGGIEPALVACLPGADHGSWARRSTTATAPGSPSTRAGSSATSSTGRRRRRGVDPVAQSPGFSQTETCLVLSLVNGSRRQPAQRSRRVIPARRAIRSSSAGHT
jgi:hypothetical protein